MKHFRSEKGEFTVEATIVFVICFITLILMLYIGIVMYQHVHFQSIADRVSSRGAMMYATRTTDMDSAQKQLSDFKNNDPYRYIFDGAYRGNAKTAVENQLKKELGTGNILTQNRDDFEKADIQLGLFTKKVTVSGKRTFNVPFVSMFAIDNSFFDLNVNSSAYILDMPETIRNVDLAMDMLHRLPGVDEAMEKVSGLKEDLEEFINKISVDE